MKKQYALLLLCWGLLSPLSAQVLELGLASYYHDYFQGKRCASGERFDQAALTGAHRSLPFGSRVRVTHLQTGRSVVVRINDRGPYNYTRCIDLSQAAARSLGLLAAGVAPVRLELLQLGSSVPLQPAAPQASPYHWIHTRSPESPPLLRTLPGSYLGDGTPAILVPRGRYAVQLAARERLSEAIAACRALEAQGLTQLRISLGADPEGKRWYRVLLGAFHSLQLAALTRGHLQSLVPDCFITTHPQAAP